MVPMGSIRHKASNSNSSVSNSEASESEESVHSIEIREPATKERRMTVDATSVMKHRTGTFKKSPLVKARQSSESLANMIASQALKK